MRHLALTLLIFSALCSSGRAELDPAVLKRAKSRVESLLGNRRGASPAPVNPANPFILPQSTTTAPEMPVAPTDIPLTKSDALTRLAASLNVSGYIEIQGVPHLTVNRQTYRQNDLIPVRDANGSVAFLLLKTITAENFVLEWEGIELLQKHTVK
jgi:hypothetical protein